MHIEQVTEPTEEVSAALARLVPQLSPGSGPSTPEHIRRLVRHPSCTVLVARAGGPRTPIVGTLTLVVFPIPTGVRAWIEDMVVDAGARGRGVGEALVREALRRARDAGAAHVNLTSNPTREAANRLYQRLGFQRRETNTYRHPLPPPE